MAVGIAVLSLIHPDALGAALLMHQARAVGRYDVLGAGPGVVADLVITHLGGNDLLEDREGAAEAAAFVRRAGWTNAIPSTFESRSMGLEKNGSCSSDGRSCLS